MNGTNPLALSGRVILITGGAQGIGEATARLCAERGAIVVIADVLREQGERTVSSIREASGSASFFYTDVRQPDQVSRLMDHIRDAHGRLDTMICAAGVLRGAWQQPEELTLEEFSLTMDVNVKGLFLCAKYATPLLVETGRGVVVIVASGAGVAGPSSSLAYSSSKGGANGFAMTLAARLGDRGVRVNVICPGNIVTELKLSVDIAAAKRQGESVEAAIKNAHQNYGLPMGVARIIAFMTSDEAEYLRGNVYTR
ncbi:MAG: SDR family NAD(P)-dependent oxidoreductase [Anaerolineae bacterium]|nr:SDR family NAD(P)-dependent oxidoreductase [Anaerolineae bacterium]